MTGRMIERLAQEILAREELRSLGLDPEAVASAIAEAKKWHDEDIAIYAVRDSAASLVPRLSAFRRALEKARREWNAIDPVDREHARRFISHDEQPQSVEVRLSGLMGVLDGFEEYFRRERGNPQRSRDGQNLDLRPLYTFVDILRGFWLEATGEDMSIAVEDRDGDTGEASSAVAPAMVFLSDAVTALAIPYSVTSLQTVVRRLRELRAK